MILANVAAAETLEKAGSPLVYRVHDEPSLEKMRALGEVLASVGHKLPQTGALRSLNCSVHEGVVEISGTVSTFYLKQLAQTAMMQLNPSGHVRNLVEVNGETSVIVATNCQPIKQ